MRAVETASYTDIKPENILFDASLIPKIADFGMAKVFGRDFTRVLTTMRGTAGYLAPEWITGVLLHQKSMFIAMEWCCWK
jgi:serine/threonine protein kinase